VTGADLRGAGRGKCKKGAGGGTGGREEGGQDGRPHHSWNPVIRPWLPSKGKGCTKSGVFGGNQLPRCVAYMSVPGLRSGQPAQVASRYVPPALVTKYTAACKIKKLTRPKRRESYSTRGRAHK